MTNDMNYHKAPGFWRQPLTPWIPMEEDFMDLSEHGGHCCIIANSLGLFDFNGTTGVPVGKQIIANSELKTDISVCTDLYQGQRNIVIVPKLSGGPHIFSRIWLPQRWAQIARQPYQPLLYSRATKMIRCCSVC